MIAFSGAVRSTGLLPYFNALGPGVSTQDTPDLLSTANISDQIDNSVAATGRNNIVGSTTPTVFKPSAGANTATIKNKTLDWVFIAVGLVAFLFIMRSR